MMVRERRAFVMAPLRYGQIYNRPLHRCLQMKSSRNKKSHKRWLNSSIVVCRFNTSVSTASKFLFAKGGRSSHLAIIKEFQIGIRIWIFLIRKGIHQHVYAQYWVKIFPLHFFHDHSWMEIDQQRSWCPFHFVVIRPIVSMTFTFWGSNFEGLITQPRWKWYLAQQHYQMPPENGFR